MVSRLWKKSKQDLRESSEKGARRAVLEDLFNDFNKNRFSVYKFNLFRGMFFGMGSIIGGTLGIAILISLLSILSNVFPPLGSFFSDLSHILQGRE